jgi:hypothetical protein
MSVITLQQAKDHLQIVTATVSPMDAQDRDITLKMAQAESIILDYLKTFETWDDETVPPLVQAAVLLQVGELFRFRGDDLPGPVYDTGQLSPTITALLRRYRDPALA